LIFPNPSSDGSFNISTNQSSGFIEIKIYTPDGKKVFSKEFPVEQIISVKNTLIPGIYVVKIKINAYFLTSKLIVQ
jgi:hypothetical protein